MELILSYRAGKMKNLIIHQNARSISSKKDELSVIFKEGCLKSSCKRTRVIKFLPGRNLASSVCHNNYLNGGVCIFVRQGILYQETNLKKTCTEKYLKYVPSNCK
jgi:hypothetical protein